MKRFIVLVLSMMLLGAAISSCGGGGGGSDSGPTNNTAVISLSTVTALYPNNGSNWNDYVKNDGSGYATVPDIACDGTETGGYSACLHGGEMRTVTVAGKTSCAGLTASDALGAFTWVCSASAGTAQFISTGLKNGKYLSDLLDFTTPGWKPNSVTVADGTKLYSTATSTAWWSNPVVVNNTGGSLATSGTIYAVTSNVTGTYSLDASKVALVSKPGVTITGPAAGTGSYVVNADGSSTAKDFLWFEGNVDATGDDTAVFFKSVRFSTLRGVKAEHANIGTWRTGILLNGSSNNNLSYVTAMNSNNGFWFDQSANNTLLYIVGSNNATGVRLNNSQGNTLTSITASNNISTGVLLGPSSNNNSLTSVSTANNIGYGVLLNQCSNNTLASMTAANNGSYGVYLYYSSNNSLTSVSAVNSGSYGVFLDYSSNNALTSVTAANNTTGVYLWYSSDNALASITATNNTDEGVTLYSSLNNALSSVAAANSTTGVYLNSSSNNNSLTSMSAANCYIGIGIENSSNNRFTGLLKVGSNTFVDCGVGGGTSPGLDDSTCTPNGTSDATLVTGITLSSTFAGKVATDDSANASDADGTATYDNITDWTSFQNPFRNWGKDGSAFPNADNRGQCTAGTCRIWDWSLASGDTVIKDVLLLPTGTSSLTHSWSGLPPSTFLRNAIELTGNGNGLCESGETCLYTPNIGAYQGHGDLESAGTIATGGTITNVTLMKYENNGR